MDIDSEHLGIPNTTYQAEIKMPAAEFQRICRDLSTIGDSVGISVSKEGVKFQTNGDIGQANITCRQEKKADSKVSIVPFSINFYLNTTLFISNDVYICDY